MTRIPDNVSMEQAAILADAVSTPYGAVVHTGQVRVGESVGIWGAGGVGMSDEEWGLGASMWFNLSRKKVLGHLGYEPADIGTLARLVSTGRLDLSRSISGIVPLEDVAEGIRILHEREGSPVRILVQP